MLTAREQFRFLVDRELGGPGLTRERRLQEALLARRCRNIFFNCIAPVVTDAGGAFPADVLVQAQTQPFGAPVIVTDILNFDEAYVVGFFQGVVWMLMRIFTSGIGAQEDFFGAGNFLNSLMTLGHYQSNATANTDAPSLKAHFMPYLMPVGQIFQVNWELLDGNTPRHQYNCEADFRGIQVLQQADPYGQLCGKIYDQVCNYIGTREPETFILDLEIPTASFPAAGIEATFNTELQERPLLIYGISTNINGAQIRMRDPSIQWEFVLTPTTPSLVVNAGVLGAGNYPNLRGLPINAVCGNGDLTYHEAYNMLPVPHLLAPNTSLAVRLTNGLRPDGTTGAYTETMNTVANFGNSTGNGHIAFLCRTV